MNPPSPATTAAAAERTFAFLDSDWRVWLERVLLGLGTALALAAVVYFFAFNWRKVPPFVRFALVEGGFAACLAGAIALYGRTYLSNLKDATTPNASSPLPPFALFAPFASFAADTALLAAAVLTGVFWAVFGQIYQTGADAWQLFALWALCILPWLLTARTKAVWTLWVIVANIGLLLWLIQANGLDIDTRHSLSLLLLPMVFNAALFGFGLACDTRSKRRSVGWSLPPLTFLLALATYTIAGALLSFSLRAHTHSLYGMHVFFALFCLALTLAAAVKLRMPAFLHMLALCGFPLLNCALIAIVPHEIFTALLLFALANIGYAFLLTRLLPPVSFTAMTGRFHTAVPSGPEAAQGRAEDVGDAAPPSGPSVIHQIIMGIAGVISALCLLALTGYILIETAGEDSPFSFALTGALFMAGGVALHRISDTSMFLKVFALSVAMAGMTLFMLSRLEDRRMLISALIFCGLTVVLYGLIPFAPLRFLTVLISFFFLMMGITDLFEHRVFSLPPSASINPLLAAAAGLPLLWLALGKKIARSTRPAAWAGIIAFTVCMPSWLFRFFGNENFFLPFHPVGRALLVLIPLLALLILLYRQKPSLLQAILVLLGLGLIWKFSFPETLLALALLALGKDQKNRSLTALGIVSLIIFLSAYYYFLPLSLRYKALQMAVSGLVLLAGAGLAALWKPAGQPTPDAPKQTVRFRLTPKGAVILALGLVTLGAFQYALFDKERLLASGKELLLPLAPKDPRSLMQGDYMELRYDASRAVPDQLFVSGDAVPTRAFIWLRTETLPNGRLVGLPDNISLTPATKEGQFSLELRWDEKRWSDATLRLPDSFFFQEGHGQLYEDARYAVLRCTPRGECLLTDLADKNGDTISGEE